MVTVHLDRLLVHGYHGLYEEEQLTGNNYEVSLDVTYEQQDEGFSSIQDTISYEDLFLIVKKRMRTPTALLEQVCEGVILDISENHPGLKEIVISIYKLQPPIENLQGRVGVTLRKQFND